MKPKKLIALICLIVLCTQILPLRQIGCMLFNNQLTEEIAHGADCGKKLSFEKDADDYLPSAFHYTSHELSITNDHSIYAHETLVNLHVAEVQTPPPNVV